AMKPGIKFLRKLGINLAPKNATREKLISVLEETGADSIMKDKSINRHCSLSIIAPELTVFIGYDNREFLMTLTDWYDCDDNWEYLTKTQGSNIMENIWVNLLGATTPNSIQNSLPTEAIGGGLASRIIFVYEKDKGQTVADPRRSITDLAEEESLRGSLLVDLGGIHALKGEYIFTDEAMDLWIDWYTNMDRDNPDLGDIFDGYLSRRQTHARKLAMIMSASRGSSMSIEKKDFERGLDLLRRTEKNMPLVFLGMGGARNAVLRMHLLAYVSKRGKVLLSDVYSDLLGYIESTKHLTDVLNMMEKDKSVKMVRQGNEAYLVYNKAHKLHQTLGGNP
ncbi:hypothetical protein LCGC14_2429680, partial [marine sediment metagenome]